MSPQSFFVRASLSAARILRGFAVRFEAHAERLVKRGSSSELSTHQQGVIGSTGYNMVTSPGEDYYCQQYLAYSSEIPMNPKQILDLGAGHGRLALEFAKRFPNSHVVGVDVSSTALSFATEMAHLLKVGNVVFREQDVESALNSTTDASIDLMLLTEVALFLDDIEQQLRLMARKLRAGGILIASFRSTYYNCLHATANRRLNVLDQIVSTNRGTLFPGSGITFNWHSSQEVCELLASSGLKVRLCAGIGALSGISGDPHSTIAQPGLLTEQQAQDLMRAELAIGKQVPDAGRYMLLIAER